jgi:hypothetical protein
MLQFMIVRAMVALEASSEVAARCSVESGLL